MSNDTIGTNKSTWTGIKVQDNYDKFISLVKSIDDRKSKIDRLAAFERKLREDRADFFFARLDKYFCFS